MLKTVSNLWLFHIPKIFSKVPQLVAPLIQALLSGFCWCFHWLDKRPALKEQSSANQYNFSNCFSYFFFPSYYLTRVLMLLKFYFCWFHSSCPSCVLLPEPFFCSLLFVSLFICVCAAIFLGSFRMPYHEIRRMIVEVDEGQLTEPMIQVLQPICGAMKTFMFFLA